MATHDVDGKFTSFLPSSFTVRDVHVYFDILICHEFENIKRLHPQSTMKLVSLLLCLLFPSGFNAAIPILNACSMHHMY